jgi:hypothetical protein
MKTPDSSGTLFGPRNVSGGSDRNMEGYMGVCKPVAPESNISIGSYETGPNGLKLLVNPLEGEIKTTSQINNLKNVKYSPASLNWFSIDSGSSFIAVLRPYSLWKKHR